MSVEQEREQAHAYLDRLPSAQLSAVRHLLESMIPPPRQGLAHIPFEDEEIGVDEEQSAAASKEWLKHNKGIPNEEVLADFGLSTEDFERMGRTPLPSEVNVAGE